MNHGWMLATSAANSFTNAFFHDNQVHDTSNWDAPGCPAHHDGIHAFGTTGSTMSGIYIYNNYFYGDWGTCPTGFIFIENGSSTPAHLSNGYYWNNVGVVNSGAPDNTNGWFGIFTGVSGETKFVNNTIIGPSPSGNTLCFSMQAITNLTFENNVASNCGNPVEISNSSVVVANYNFYGPSCANGGNCFLWNGAFTGSFTNWKAACACDSNGAQNNTPSLNSDGSPQAGSPIIGLATNLMTIATGTLATLAHDTSRGSTRTPIVRPTGTAWDKGAYQFGGSIVSQPLPPSGLVVTVQ